MKTKFIVAVQRTKAKTTTTTRKIRPKTKERKSKRRETSEKINEKSLSSRRPVKFCLSRLHAFQFIFSFPFIMSSVINHDAHESSVFYPLAFGEENRLIRRKQISLHLSASASICLWLFFVFGHQAFCRLPFVLLCVVQFTSLHRHFDISKNCAASSDQPKM